MNLKKKILVGYGISFALLILVVAWAVTNIVALGNAADAILRENYRSIIAARHMMEILSAQDRVVLRAAADPAGGTPEFRSMEAEFFQWLARAKDNVTIEGEGAQVRSIEEAYTRYRNDYHLRYLPTASASRDPERNSALYASKAGSDFAEANKACAELLRMNEKTMYEASDGASRAARVAIWSTSIVALSALITALFFSLFLSERIVRPVGKFIQAARKISSGEYSIQVPVDTKDELGSLASEFNQMASRLEKYHELNIDQIVAEKNKISAILSSIADGIVVFDTNMKISGINPAARRILSLEFAEYGSIECKDVSPSPKVCETIEAMISTGTQPDIPDDERIFSVEENGKVRYFLYSVTAVKGKQQSLTGVVLLLKDITHLKEIERLKTEFVTAAAHELKTPLTSMGMSVDLLLEKAETLLPEKERSLLLAAHDEVHRMKALVSDLLDLSKIEAGKIELEMDAVDVGSLFELVKTIFKDQAVMKNVAIETDAQDGLPPVRADWNKTTWVLTNLVSNALRYVGEKGSILLKASRIDTDIHVSVRDNGSGIPLEQQSRIFDKLVQAPGRSNGSGLGLAICKEIVRAHGGTIWVESAPGEGSTFTFTLPALTGPVERRKRHET